MKRKHFAELARDCGGYNRCGKRLRNAGVAEIEITQQYIAALRVESARQAAIRTARAALIHPTLLFVNLPRTLRYAPGRILVEMEQRKRAAKQLAEDAALLAIVRRMTSTYGLPDFDGDRDYADATCEPIARRRLYAAIRKMGGSRISASPGSAYYQVHGTRIRISDHDLPMHAEREHNWSQGWKSFDYEIVLYHRRGLRDWDTLSNELNEIATFIDARNTESRATA
jgi:hypothetical protein